MKNSILNNNDFKINHYNDLKESEVKTVQLDNRLEKNLNIVLENEKQFYNFSRNHFNKTSQNDEYKPSYSSLIMKEEKDR